MNPWLFELLIIVTELQFTTILPKDSFWYIISCLITSSDLCIIRRISLCSTYPPYALSCEWIESLPYCWSSCLDGKTDSCSRGVGVLFLVDQRVDSDKVCTPCTKWLNHVFGGQTRERKRQISILTPFKKIPRGSSRTANQTPQGSDGRSAGWCSRQVASASPIRCVRANDGMLGGGLED